MFKSTLKVFVFSFSIIFSSCVDDCLDMDVITEYTEIMESWYLNSSISSTDVTSSIGITEQVSISQNYNDYGDTIWDDCDNTTNSTRNEILYHFQNFPFDIEVIFDKQGEEDGFSYKLNINYEYNSIYLFNSQSTDSDNPIYYIENITLNEINYPEVLKAEFHQANQPTEIKNIYYAKGIGIVQIELNQGTILYFDYF